MGGRPSLSGNSIDRAATVTTAENSGLWTLGFNYYLSSPSTRYIKPMGSRPGLPGNGIERAATITIAANSGLWTLGFNYYLSSPSTRYTIFPSIIQRFQIIAFHEGFPDHPTLQIPLMFYTKK